LYEYTIFRPLQISSGEPATGSIKNPSFIVFFFLLLGAAAIMAAF
jgi:LPXTG-motif cell wall-anchored protein